MARRSAPERRARWMAWSFGLGSTCFLIGPFPGYAELVGGTADAITFFVGSIFFTTGGALQTWLAFPFRHEGGEGSAAWWAAIVRSAGTLFFNPSPSRPLSTVATREPSARLVWRPDGFGSVCFLVSGAIAYRASARRGVWPARGERGWWAPAVNLLGCVFFG